MDFRQYSLPSTPRQQRGPLGNRETQPSPGTRSWRGSRHLNRSRGRNGRFRGNHRCPPYSPPFEGRPYMSTPRRDNAPYGRFSMHRQSTSRPRSPFACSADNDVSDEGLLAEPTKVPVVISPNSRERSYSEIMNGAFDLRKSPLGLGKRLAETALPSVEDWKFQSPFDASSSEHSKPDLPTPTRRSKRDASSQIGPLLKQPKSAHPSSGQYSGSSYNPVANALDASPFGNRTDPVTVGYAMPQLRETAQSPELANLLEMVNRNTQQSRRLADLVSKYIKEHSANLREAAPVEKAGGPPLSKELDDKIHPDPPLQLSTLASGGDSPDPPRDHLDPFRGHMIDSVDILSKSPLKTPEPDNECGPENASTRQPTSCKAASPNADHDNDAYSIVSDTRSCLSGMIDVLAIESLMEDPEYLAPNVYDSKNPNTFIQPADDASICSQQWLRRWRTGCAPSPDSQAPFCLKCDTAPWASRSDDEAQSPVGGKTPPRPCNSPDVMPKLVKVPGFGGQGLPTPPESDDRPGEERGGSSSSTMTCVHVENCLSGSTDRDGSRENGTRPGKQQNKEEKSGTCEHHANTDRSVCDLRSATTFKPQDPQERSQRRSPRL